MAPQLPYIDVPQEIPIPLIGHLPEAVANIPILNTIFTPGHPPSIKTFGMLVAFGVWIGSVVAVRHAKARNIDERKMGEFIFWSVGIGFIGAHVLDAIFYHPDAVKRDPFYIFKLWEGISSYGGFVGAAFGAFLWRYSRKQPILNMCECINSAFPLAWVFGRLGCSTVHDHPGHTSTMWLAVKWPHLPEGVGKFDLGLLEFLYAIPLALSYLWLWKKKPDRPLGFYTGIMFIAYAPVRFVFDFLREEEGANADPRYGGLTPAQWGCFGLLAFGVYFLSIARKGGSTIEPEPVKDEEEEEDDDDDDDEEEESEPKPKPKKKAPAKKRRKAA